MDLETISNRILDSNFGLTDRIEHSDEDRVAERDDFLSPDNYLTHYGIKGMKWGIRKEYESHPRKKNRYGKKLVKTIKKTKGGYSDKKRAIKPIVNKMITDDIANQIEKAHSDLMKNRPNVNFAEIDDEVFYLMERDYDRLEKIAKKKLKTENDDAIFQEILDIAENEVMSKYPGVKEQNDRWEKAVSNYMSEVTRITNEIVGEFSDIKINPNDPYSSTIGKYVEGTIFDYIEEKFNKGSLA